MEIDGLIDRLEDLMTQSLRVPGLGRRLIDEGELFHLIDRLRAAVPGDIRQAKVLLREREAVLEDARQEAQQILGRADEAVSAHLGESRLLREAEERARRLLDEARAKADAILDQVEGQLHERRREADRYAQEVLRQLEAQLTGLLTSVRRGLEVLDKGAQT